MTNKVQLFHIFATFDPGGPQVRMSMIINSLPKYFHHSIMALDQKLDAQRLIKDRVNVNYITPSVRGSSLSLILRLAKIIYLMSPSIILTYNWGAMDAVFAARLCRFKKIIHMEVGFRPDEAEGSQKKRRIFYRRFLLRHISGVVVPSLNLKDIAENIWRLPRDKIFYIPNGVDCDHFSPGKAIEARQRLNIEDEACVIGTVAHIREVKNFGMLLRAFANIQTRFPLHLLFIGDGPERGMLENLAKKMDVQGRVHFLGYKQDPSECYRMMDIFAMSSKTEQMPVSVLEAMATGLPILSTDVGDVGKMVDDENRFFIVPRENDSVYKAALKKLVNSKEKRIYLGMKNRQKCLSEYRHDQMIAAYHNLYKKVLYSS